MKTKVSWLWALVLIGAMIQSVQLNEAQAQQAQLAQVMQPDKELALQATTTGSVSRTQSQPSKAEVLSAIQGTMPVQPSKEEALTAVEARLPAAVSAQAASSCSLCLTCGGDWPMFSGAIPTRKGARPFERGSSCVGDLTSRSDTLPYLCCNSGQ